LFEGLHADRPADVHALMGFMNACNAITLFDMEHGRPLEALAMQQRAVELNEALVVAAPESLAFRTGLPRRTHNLARALESAGRDSEAIVMVRRGLAGFTALVQEHPDDPMHRAALAQATSGFAEMMLRRGAPADTVLPAVRRSMALQERLMRERPDDLVLQRRYAQNLFLLAEVAASRQGEPDTAASYARLSAGFVHRASLADPGNADLRLSEAIGEVTLGYYLAASGHAGEASAHLEPALAQFEHWSAADTTDTRLSAEVVEAHDALGMVDETLARRAFAKGAPSAAHWRQARAHFTKAATLLRAMIAGGDAWARSRATEAPVRVNVAACDSALALASAVPRR
jgi:tetratricopeptide (TPR) repeat protein